MSTFRLLFVLLLLVPAPALSQVFAGKVTAIRTGDRFVFARNGVKRSLRIAKIETPALNQSGGHEAKDAIALLCLHRPAWIESDSLRSKSVRLACRWDREHWADAGLYQVQQGWARLLPDVADAPYVLAQKTAQAACDGAWFGGDPPFTACTAFAGFFQGSGGTYSGATGPARILYVVTGTATAAIVTIATPGDGTEQHKITLPWYGSTYQFSPGEFVYLSAQQESKGTSITVQILLDGQVKKSASATADYGIATVSCSRGQGC